MDNIDNNQFEVKPINSKRKIAAPCPNVYLNPALDLLVNEDPMCNTAMEIVPNKKRKRTKSCDIATFENSALDLGISKAAVNEFLVRELENVKRNLKSHETGCLNTVAEYPAPIDAVPKTALSCDNVLKSFTEFDNFAAPNFVSTCTNPALDLNATKSNAETVTSNTLEVVNPHSILFHASSINYSNTTNVTDNATNAINIADTEPIYANLTEVTKNTDNTVDVLQCPDISTIAHEDFDSGISVLEQKSLRTANNEISNISNTIQTSVTNQVIINNSNLSLSFIDRLAIDSPNVSDQSLYLDDDLNESNIMEIKTITIITKKKRIVEKKNTYPFLEPNLNSNEIVPATNPFIDMKQDVEYQEEVLNRVPEIQAPNANNLMPRRLFSGDTNSTISTVNESSIESQHDYENIDTFRSESPIYENIEEANFKPNKILGYDVSQYSANITNLNKNQGNSSNDSQDSKKDLKHSFLKAGNKLSKKVFKTLKKTFKHDKVDSNATLNPYEVPRKVPKQKETKKDSGIENPALNLDNSDDLEIEELSDEEHQYETVKTRRNTQLNMNVTPLRVKDNDIDFIQNRTYTPGKKVRFDSTLNQEKIITGNSFDYGMQSPGFDAKIDKYHDELENCINERKFIQQNM